MGSEVEILTSWDLAVQVADAIGAKRLLPGSQVATQMDAAETVSAGLEVTLRKGSDIIFVSYRNPDPQLATLVLNELVNRYFEKHLEVHRSAGAFDFVTQQADQVRARLNQTEDALKALKAKAGIASSADSAASLSAEVVKIEDQFHSEETDLAEQRARVKQMETSVAEGHEVASLTPATQATASPSPSLSHQPASGDIQQYQALNTRLVQLRETGLALLSQYTPANQLVKSNETQIAALETQKHAMEKKFPDLASAPATGAQGQSDIGFEKARLAGFEAKTEAMKVRLQERIRQLTEVGSQIADLERKKELEEANYKYFQGTLEKARIDEALDPSKMPNISAVQRPSPPMMVTKKRDKLALELAGGGLALGLALALLSELLLNRSVKRPLELEKRLGAPPLLSIPYSTSNGHQLTDRKKRRFGRSLILPQAAHQNLPPWEDGHFIRPYATAIRDRVDLYFERNRMTHKPKLVGVTSFSNGAGTSTLAAGLAAALSEMGDGKVLLVDVNVGHAEAHPFFRGTPVASLSALLNPTGPVSSAADNLYLATVSPPNAGPVQRALKRFFELMPNLKASDFDYIIFDMPPLSDTSPTLGMTSFMDKVLLVVEAGKNNRDLVARGYSELVAGHASISVILNKVRSYTPKWLEVET
jgi:polysaccharide biosynthesis transport protein